MRPTAVCSGSSAGPGRGPKPTLALGSGYTSYSLNSSKGGYIGDYIGESYRGYYGGY